MDDKDEIRGLEKALSGLASLELGNFGLYLSVLVDEICTRITTEFAHPTGKDIIEFLLHTEKININDMNESLDLISLMSFPKEKEIFLAYFAWQYL